MKISKQDVKELLEKGSVEIRYFISGKEFWETLELEE
jgi:hypothetical protein